MKFIVPVALREYETTWIAETLTGPAISVADETSKSTLNRLRNALSDVYARTHPRLLKDALKSYQIFHTQEVRPLFRSGRYEWVEDDGTAWHDNLVSVPIDIISIERASELSELFLLQFDLKSVTRHNDEIDVIDRMLDVVRESSWSTAAHRPTAKSTQVVDLEIDFQPVDLTKVRPESIYIDEFSRHELQGGVSEKTTPTLNKVGQKWSFDTQKDAENSGFHELFGRPTLVSEVLALLDGEKPTPVVLIGPTRAGKTALVRHLGWARSQKDIEKKRPIFFADSPRLVSTAQGGLWQEQVQEIFRELEATDSILYLGRLLAALDAGKFDGSDYNLAQFLRPILSNHRVRVIAEATPEEWAELEKRDIGFAHTFTVLRVEDPPPKKSKEIVDLAIARFLKNTKFTIDDNLSARAWALQERFAVYGSPVGRTIEFLIRTLRRAQSQYKDHLSEEDLVDAFCEDSGLPSILLSDAQQLRPETVYNALSKRVLGQHDAIQSVANIISITKAGLSSPDRPLGSFMFVGPTGVGKTELAKSLATFLFGSEDRMIRLDMSEYANDDAYGRLIGEGSHDGDLAGPVQREPFCVILLDEIEKAHPTVYDVLLQVLGEARLTDVQGKTTRFQNTIIIMTSNLGVDSMRPSIGFGESKPNDYFEHFRKEAEKFYRPEFLGRIDQFIAFHALPIEVVTQIAKRALSKLQDRDGFISQDISIAFTDEVAPFLAENGYDAKYGARPLKRAIEQSLVWKLAKKLAETQKMTGEGASRKVTISISKNKIKINIKNISLSKDDIETRSSLLQQVDNVSDLRRRLASYVHTSLFGELEWEVENFDLSTQSPNFWDDPRAAELAANAEKRRKVVNPAREITNELAALEDLSAEAYHTRSFDLVPDIKSRVGELEKRIDEIFIEAMNASYEIPNEIVLFLFDHSPTQPFGKLLINWYKQWATHKGWEFSVWEALDFTPPEEKYRMDIKRKSWKEIKDENYKGELFAIHFKGFNARPLIRVEEGIHRYISNAGNGTCHIVTLDEQSGWPFSNDVAKHSHQNYSARTYNFRMNDITLYFGSRVENYGISKAPLIVKLNPEDPITSLEETIIDEAWELSAMDWE